MLSKLYDHFATDPEKLFRIQQDFIRIQTLIQGITAAGFRHKNYNAIFRNLETKYLRPE
jgi:hypothetical protein